MARVHVQAEISTIRKFGLAITDQLTMQILYECVSKLLRR